MIRFSVLLHAKHVIQIDRETNETVVGGAYAWKSCSAKTRDEAIALATASFDVELRNSDDVWNAPDVSLSIEVDEMRVLSDESALFNSGVVFYVETH